MSFLSCRLAFLLLLSLFLSPSLPATRAVQVNITIDDTYGDPITGAKFEYFPVTSWNIGGGCDGCTAPPDANQVNQRTWHQGTFAGGNSSTGSNVLTATVPFSGNAVYVYCILSLSQNSPTSDMTFYIDGDFVGRFSQAPLGQAGFRYNVQVFSNTSLSSGNHSLTIQNGRANGSKSLILLDYIVYTVDNTTQPGALSMPGSAAEAGVTSSNNAGRVVGAVFGTLFALLFIALAVLAYRRYKKGQPIVPSVRTDRIKRAFPSLPLPGGGGSSSAHKSPTKKSRSKSTSFDPQLLVASVKTRVKSMSIRGVGGGGGGRAPRPPPKDRDQSSNHHRLALTPQSSQHQQMSSHNHSSTELPYLTTTTMYTHSPSAATEEFIHARSSPAPLLAAAYADNQQHHLHHPQPRHNNDAHYPSGSSFSSKIESIHRWQRQTMEETKGRRVESMLGAPEQPEELESYYEETPTESHRVRTPPPPPRRYTVVNN